MDPGGIKMVFQSPKYAKEKIQTEDEMKCDEMR